MPVPPSLRRGLAAAAATGEKAGGVVGRRPCPLGSHTAPSRSLIRPDHSEQVAQVLAFCITWMEPW